MSWDIQINPTAEALHVSYELVEALDEFVEDFDIRYCALEPSDEAIAVLRRVPAQGPEEQSAIDQIVANLQRGEAVELLIGH
jgi:dihydroorotase